MVDANPAVPRSIACRICENIPDHRSQHGAQPEIIGQTWPPSAAARRWPSSPITTSSRAIDIYGAVQGRDLGGVARDIEPIVDAQQERSAARLADHRARPDSRPCALVLLGSARRLGLLHRAGLSADRGQLPILARSVHHHHGAARRAGRHRLVPFRHPHHAQRAGADGRHHVHGRGHRQQHSGGQLSPRSTWQTGQTPPRPRSKPASRASAP